MFPTFLILRRCTQQKSGTSISPPRPPNISTTNPTIDDTDAKLERMSGTTALRLSNNSALLEKMKAEMYTSPLASVIHSDPNNDGEIDIITRISSLEQGQALILRKYNTLETNYKELVDRVCDANTILISTRDKIAKAVSELANLSTVSGQQQEMINLQFQKWKDIDENLQSVATRIRGKCLPCAPQYNARHERTDKHNNNSSVENVNDDLFALGDAVSRAQLK
jgi:hypothetical protein